MVSGVRQRLMHGAQDVVEQALMPALLHEAAQRAGGERREIDRQQLRGDAAGDESHQARGFRRRDRLGQQAQREAARDRSLRLRSRSQSATKAPKSIWRSLASTGAGFEKMHLDEFAELVGDAVLVALDDRGVRDRQSQRPA